MWYSLTCWQLMAWQQGQDVLCKGGDKNGSIANDSSALPCFCNGSLSFSPLSFAPSSNYNIKGKGYPLKLERGVHFSWARFMQGQSLSTLPNCIIFPNSMETGTHSQQLDWVRELTVKQGYWTDMPLNLDNHSAIPFL